MYMYDKKIVKLKFKNMLNIQCITRLSSDRFFIQKHFCKSFKNVLFTVKRNFNLVYQVFLYV